MTRTRVKIDPDHRRGRPAGRVNYEVLDTTTERDIATQQRQDDAEVMQDMAKFARRVRKRLGFTQQEFARRIDVPQEALRNWEQGKRCSTGAAKALLRVLDKAPETALFALHWSRAASGNVSIGQYSVLFSASAFHDKFTQRPGGYTAPLFALEQFPR